MSLLVLAYPVLAAKDFNWIQSHRKEHDELYGDTVEPHFTLVFPVSDKIQEVFTYEVELQSQGCSAISFEINKAMAVKDVLSEYWHEFLVPDKGNDEIIRLHDKLYSGALQSNLRHDIEYLPHISIGNSKDWSKCVGSVMELKKQTLSISGTIESLTIAEYADGVVKKLKTIELR